MIQSTSVGARGDISGTRSVSSWTLLYTSTCRAVDLLNFFDCAACTCNSLHSNSAAQCRQHTKIYFVCSMHIRL